MPDDERVQRETKHPNNPEVKLVCNFVVKLMAISHSIPSQPLFKTHGSFVATSQADVHQLLYSFAI